eukprot:2876054-Amphidinium_carterae.2
MAASMCGGNLSSSLFWQTSWGAKAAKLDGHTCDFDLCVFGGPRPKRERWLISNMNIPNLSRSCDGRHQHEHFQSIYAAGRRVQKPPYPSALCKLFASVALDWARATYWPHLAEGAPPASCMLPVLEKQPRHQLPHLLDEFIGRMTVHLETCPPALQYLPEHGRYGRFSHCVHGGVDGPQRWKCEVGLLLNEEEFLLRSLLTKHPFNNCTLMH